MDILAAAEAARDGMRRATPAERAGWLTAAADALDAAAGELIELAHAETHLPVPRLTGELKRTTFQARLFASADLAPVLHEPADPAWGMGPKPALVRTVVPIGPVLVFAASNFPFAFSVFGGDTVSALAAGCPVIVKAHPGHPLLSRRTAEIVRKELPFFGLIEGVEEGLTALRDPRIKAVGFTGSTAGGRALFDIAAARPEPIPFYGELGSVNPVVVTPAAWAERGTGITREWVGSLTLGAGQFCTNPGVVLVPDADGFLAGLELPAPGRMLTSGLEQGYADAVHKVADVPGVRTAVSGPANEEGVTASVLRMDAGAVLADPSALDIEMFGPAGLVVEYAGPAQLAAVLRLLPGQLTGTVQALSDGDDPVAADVVELLAEKAGRIVYNDWPTGVTVSAAQHHGGPYPATTSPTSTSVGLHAIARWQRPVTFQGTPPSAMPAHLR